MDVSALKKLPAKYILIILLVLGIVFLVIIKLLSDRTPQQKSEPFSQFPLPKPPSSSIPLPSTKTPSFPLSSPETTKSKERGDPDFKKTINENLFKYFPLLKEIPYETNEFKVIYSKPLQLTVELKPSISTQSAETKVLNWIQSKGVNPSTHKIIFK